MVGKVDFGNNRLSSTYLTQFPNLCYIVVPRIECGCLTYPCRSRYDAKPWATFMEGYTMKTIFAKKDELKSDWYIIDASGKTLGRVAAKAAAVLRGKNKATYTPNEECGDHVVIINADKVVVSGNKGEDMLYRHYTGFIGGLKELPFDTLIAKHPTEPLRRTIAGMLPHNRLGRSIINNLKIYAGSEHPHVAQNPQPLEV